MSHDHMELVRRLYSAMNAGDFAASSELAHPDAEWIPDSRVPEGPVRGRENVVRFFQDRAEMFVGVGVEVERVWDLGDRVLVFVRLTGRGQASDAPFELRIAHLWTFRDGVVVRGEGYGNRAEALEAAGLRE